MKKINKVGVSKGVSPTLKQTAIPRALPLAENLAEHIEQLKDCRRCLHLNPFVAPVAKNPNNPQFMLLGQAPGRLEREAGRGFIGKAGKRLFSWLGQAGAGEQWFRREAYICSVIRCYPGPHSSGRGDRIPSKVEQGNCAPWLEREIDLIQPKLLIVVGGLAIRKILGEQPLSEVVGKKHLIKRSWGPMEVVALPHPSGASTWFHKPAHKILLNKSLTLLEPYFQESVSDEAELISI